LAVPRRPGPGAGVLASRHLDTVSGQAASPGPDFNVNATRKTPPRRGFLLPLRLHPARL